MPLFFHSWHYTTHTHDGVSLQKERDLELAARIGQSLLNQNKELTERNKLLDEQLEIAQEEVIKLLLGCHDK